MKGRPPWYRRLAARIEARKEIHMMRGRIDTDTPYMVRYYVFRSKLVSIYLHKILTSDDAPDFHDHPWPFFHVILEGFYVEQTPRNRPGRLRRAGDWAFRRARYAHRIEKAVMPDGEPAEVWTLVVRGPTSRSWGFIDRISGCWIDWKRYVAGERC